ncbi:hypothetical protein PSI23_21325, partial [Xenorhabdus sp. XENO-10]
IVHHLLEKGDKEQAMDWLEGLLDWTGEDLLSEAENNASDLNGWVDKRMENEVSITKALEIIHSQTPSVEKIKKLLEEATKKLAEYENMKPVAYRCMLTGEIYTEIPKTDKTNFLALLYYHPNRYK